MCASCTHSVNYVKLEEKVNKSWKVILSSLKREADPRIQFTTFHSFYKEFLNNDITTPLCHPVPPCFIFHPLESRILKSKKGKNYSSLSSKKLAPFGSLTHSLKISWLVINTWTDVTQRGWDDVMCEWEDVFENVGNVLRHGRVAKCNFLYGTI